MPENQPFTLVFNQVNSNRGGLKILVSPVRSRPTPPDKNKTFKALCLEVLFF